MKNSSANRGVFGRRTFGYVAALALLILAGAAGAEQPAAAVAVRTAVVDGLTLQYLEAGRGPAVVLLHGYAETSRMWRPLMPQLADRYRVMAPDLPGIGGSAVPKDGLDMTSAAKRIHALIRQLGVEHAVVVGHDIGLMVAYAYAAQFPDEVDRLVLMDAFLPGVKGWEAIYNHPAIWHFRFNGSTPEALVKGRERTYFEHFWNDFAADPTHSVSEADRRIYAKAYAQPGGMRAGFEYFKNFERDAKDFAELGVTPLSMPVLVLGGEKSGGEFLIAQTKLVASNVQGKIISGSGHWLMDEAPQTTIPALTTFLNAQP
jgi:pimeloyl-ACP methyl ester carboxylesterase